MLISIRRGRSAAGSCGSIPRTMSVEIISNIQNQVYGYFWQHKIKLTAQNRTVWWEGRQGNINLTKWDRSIHFKWTSSSITIFFIFSQWSWTLWSFICQWLITVKRHEHILVHLHKYSRSTALMVAVLCLSIPILSSFILLLWIISVTCNLLHQSQKTAFLN